MSGAAFSGDRQPMRSSRCSCGSSLDLERLESGDRPHPGEEKGMRECRAGAAASLR